MSTDTLRKMRLFGIGIIALTQERLEEFTQEMIKKGEMDKEEGKRFVVDVLLEKDRQFKEIEEKIKQNIKDIIDHSGFATKKDIYAIEKRLDMLEKDLTITLMTQK